MARFRGLRRGVLGGIPERVELLLCVDAGLETLGGRALRGPPKLIDAAIGAILGSEAGAMLDSETRAADGAERENDCGGEKRSVHVDLLM